ncbi:uncharacterized protein LOC127539010 isoform X2 [Antechinus flavipes]|uniref:uncharacterized protein LOC127539010 isoform X2 n=1 Tax=Antechinus flavipes TaxID=38775 RepID=UPI0022361CC1|nr:uncharacterized protein LOC127539010 isoform X2 [Antechinus flavipes]
MMKKQEQPPQHPHPEAIMPSNQPASFPKRPQKTSQLRFQGQEKDPALLRPEMPSVNSSRTWRQDPGVAQNASQSQGEANLTINSRKKQKQPPQHPHPEAIMPSNQPASFPKRPQQTSQLRFQGQEKDPALLRPEMPSVNSSRTWRQDPGIAQNADQSQGVPRSSNNKTALTTHPIYPSAAEIHKMTYEQVVSSILQFLGNDPQYMASVDPKQQKLSKSSKGTQNRK